MPMMRCHLPGLLRNAANTIEGLVKEIRELHEELDREQTKHQRPQPRHIDEGEDEDFEESDLEKLLYKYQPDSFAYSLREAAKNADSVIKGEETAEEFTWFYGLTERPT